MDAGFRTKTSLRALREMIGKNGTPDGHPGRPYQPEGTDPASELSKVKQNVVAGVGASVYRLD